MEQIELILSIAIPAVSFLSAAIGLLIKLLAAVKEKNLAKAQTALEEAAKDAVSFVEGLKSRNGDDLLGETKKSIALIRINEALINKGIRFDEEKAGEVIEELVKLTKQVNYKKK